MEIGTREPRHMSPVRYAARHEHAPPGKYCTCTTRHEYSRHEQAAADSTGQHQAAAYTACIAGAHPPPPPFHFLFTSSGLRAKRVLLQESKGAWVLSQQDLLEIRSWKVEIGD